LIADRKILSKINNIRNRAKSQKKKYREEINVKFALYVVMSLLLLALIVFIKAPKQQN
jgi:quinol-cytochrome oxidoreductase complex cytochrome b subunit